MSGPILTEPVSSRRSTRLAGVTALARPPRGKLSLRNYLHLSFNEVFALSPMRHRIFLGWLVVLVVLNLLVRLPLCTEPATVTPDGAEYLAIARSLREEGRYATDLKWQFFTDDPVRHPAWVDRPPLYPLYAVLCARVLPFLDPTTAARVGNVLLACVALVLGVLHLRRLFGPVTALLAAGYVFLLPHTLYWTTQPLTEALTLVLCLAALLLWDHAREARKGPVHARLLLAAGAACGLAYLTRPTGLLLVFALLLDACLPGPNPGLHPNRTSEGPIAPPRAPGPPYLDLQGPYLPGPYLLAAFLLFAVPYHLILWKVAGSPFASALGFTYRIRTIHEVTVLGFERTLLPLPAFLAQHGAELPALLLRQAGSHAQGILLPLLGLLPFALGMRRADFTGSRRAPFLAVLLLVVMHTLTWSAKGSSRYFLLCLLLLAALLLCVGFREGERVEGTDHEPDQGNAPSTGSGRPTPTPTPTRSRRPGSSFILHPSSFILLLTASALGLAFELTRFYAAQLGPGRGAPEHVAWKAAAAQVRGARLIASDNPWSLNLLAERPAMILPRTTDPEKLARFVRKYQPDVLVLFPNEEAERPMAAAWRAGRLPPGWRLTHDGGEYLLVQPTSVR